jgi:serine phosphatase RsbU (regulator of sigma subunit)/pSer/pThr/pTyr-binding forkhead associated (FHA) protein
VETPSFFLKVEPPAAAPFRFECSGDSVVVGRSSSADVHVADRFLSRKHARLYRQDDGWYVETLSTRSPTLLNGTAVGQPTRLKPGDVLRLAETVLRVAPGESSVSSGQGGAAVRPSRPSFEGSRILRSAATMLDAPVLTADPAALERQSSRMALLNEVHRALAQPISRQELLDLVLDRAFAHLTPEEGTIYLKGPDGELEQAAIRRVPGMDGEPFQSRRLADEVVGRGLAALVQDASLDDRFAAAESIMISGVRSIVAAPLLDSEGCLGMIMLHSRIRVRQFSEEDMELLVSLAAAAALRIRNLNLTEEAAERKILERELSLAHEIQMGMLPRDFPERPEIDIGATLQPARSVGGDLYDVLADGSRLWFLAGDVSGKGVGAALFMAVTRTLFRAVAPAAASIGDLASRMNAELARDNEKAMFVTAFAGCLDLANGHLEFVNAGHLPPVRLGTDGTVEVLEASPGLPLGALGTYSHVSRHMTLRPGDALFLYTDGITEAENAEKRQFSMSRLLEALRTVVAAPSSEVVDATLAAVRAHAGETPPSDDLTALVLRFRGSR